MMCCRCFLFFTFSAPVRCLSPAQLHHSCHRKQKELLLFHMYVDDDDTNQVLHSCVNDFPISAPIEIIQVINGIYFVFNQLTKGEKKIAERLNNSD